MNKYKWPKKKPGAGKGSKKKGQFKESENGVKKKIGLKKFWIRGLKKKKTTILKSNV